MDAAINVKSIVTAKAGTTGIAKDVSEELYAERNIPTSTLLKQNYPDPFNPATKIAFTLDGDANVSLKVYDMLGREVSTLVEGVWEAGTQHQVFFDASRFSSGMYIYRLQAGNRVLTQKMMLMK